MDKKLRIKSFYHSRITLVIPAMYGIQKKLMLQVLNFFVIIDIFWIPAFAGMTRKKQDWPEFLICNSRYVILLLLLSTILSGCSGDQCIDADDFGFSNVTVSARYSKEELSQQFGAEQVAPWRDSGYKVNGQPLVIVVRGWTQGVDGNSSSELSAWCPWYGQASNTNTLSTFCERLQECRFIDDTMCTNTKDAAITNAPCIFKLGVGLYALIANQGSDPNVSFTTQIAPSGLTFHLGEQTTGYQMFDIDTQGNIRQAGGLVYKYQDDQNLQQQYANSSLYFKILDKFYDDNSGQYRIIIKSGITNTVPDPITYVTNLVQNFLFGTDGDYGLVRKLYMSIVSNPGYRMAVSGLLTLYIMWTALSYLAGNVQVTHTELLLRIIKIGIVAALLSSTYSWSFFNDYLFVWFVGGVEQILQMITAAGATGPGSPSILGMMLAPQTMAKLFSLLFVDPLGFIYIILFMFALYFVIMIYFEAAVIYLTALIAIGMIITMGPIFICFLLFGVTRSLFENWLRQLISYAVQPIILFTGLVFISIILKQEIYGSLGFKVCKQTFPEMNNGGGAVISDFTKNNLGIDVGSSIFYWWFPMPMRGEQFSRNLVNIPIPIEHYANGEESFVNNQNDGDLCAAYGCVGPRYVDLPFLDPVKDTRRLNQFWNGKFVQLDGMFLIFVAIYLLHKFNGVTLSIAKFITNTSGNLTDVRKVSDGATGGIRKMVAKAGDMAKNRMARTTVGRAAIRVSEGVSAIKEQIKQAPSRLIDKVRVAALKKEALSDNVNKAVADEVRKQTGLDSRNLKPKAVESYKEALRAKLQKIDSSLTTRQAAEIAEKLSYKGFKELQDEFAKAKYGRLYKDLAKSNRADIDKILQDKHTSTSNTKELQKKFAKEKYGKRYSSLARGSASRRAVDQAVREYQDKNKQSLRQLAGDANAAMRYQEAYVDAYQALSERGVGLIGKRVDAFRTLKEINYEREKARELEKAERQQTGREIYSGYASLKRDMYRMITGSEKDRVGHTFFGGDYDEIDYSKVAKNKRLQTYDEILADQRRDLEYEGVRKRIDDLSREKGGSILAPEFLAKAREAGDPGLGEYLALQQEQVKKKVYEELSKGDDPVLKGERFVSKYASDEETAGMIDRAEAIKREMLKDDQFVSREGYYEGRVEEAAEGLLEKKTSLENYFKRSVTDEEIPQLYAQHSINQGDSRQKTQEKVQAVKYQLTEFQEGQKILQEIDQRKQVIVQEIDKHTEHVNEHRVKSGLQKHVPTAAQDIGQVGVRAFRKIDDYRKKK